MIAIIGFPYWNEVCVFEVDNPSQFKEICKQKIRKKEACRVKASWKIPDEVHTLKNQFVFFFVRKKILFSSAF
jgi:hypothetical protein